jgi:hypothetical protein
MKRVMTMVQLMSRRGLFVAASAVTLAGCSQSLSPEEEEARDPYLTLIRNDPMFKWTPSGDLLREERFSPLNSRGPNPDQFALAIVTYRVGSGVNVHALMDLASEMSSTFGYVHGYRQLTPEVGVLLKITRSSGGAGFSNTFKAPVS